MRKRCYDRVSQVGRIFRMPLVQPPDKIRVETNPDQVSQGFVHLHLKNLQGQRFHKVSRKLSPMLDFPWWFFSFYQVRTSPTSANDHCHINWACTSVQYLHIKECKRALATNVLCFGTRYWGEATLWWPWWILVNVTVDISESYSGITVTSQFSSWNSHTSSDQSQLADFEIW